MLKMEFVLFQKIEGVGRHSRPQISFKTQSAGNPIKTSRKEVKRGSRRRLHNSISTSSNIRCAIVKINKSLRETRIILRDEKKRIKCNQLSNLFQLFFTFHYTKINLIDLQIDFFYFQSIKSPLCYQYKIEFHYCTSNVFLCNLYLFLFLHLPAVLQFT